MSNYQQPQGDWEQQQETLDRMLMESSKQADRSVAAALSLDYDSHIELQARQLAAQAAWNFDEYFQGVE